LTFLKEINLFHLTRKCWWLTIRANDKIKLINVQTKKKKH